MPVSSTTKPTQKQKDQIKQDEKIARAAWLAGMVDELGLLEREYAPLKNKFDRIEILRRNLREAFGTTPESEPARVDGARFSCDVGPRGPQKTVDNAKLFKVLGARGFLTVCFVTLKNLDRFVAKDIAREVVSTALTGPRSLTVFERAAS